MRPGVRRVLLAVLTIAALVVLVIDWTAGAATAAGGPTFDTVTWGHDTLVVSGVQMVEQTGAVHVTDAAENPPDCWHFRLFHGSDGTGSVNSYFTGATLTSGTRSDGVWTMTFYVSSTMDGSWHLALAESCSSAANYPVGDGPTFTITGHHQPRLTWGTDPAVVRAADPYATVKGRVYDADTGAGMPGLTVGRDEDVNCIFDYDYGASPSFHFRTKTNSNGYYAFPSTAVGYNAFQCIGVIGTVTRNPDGYTVYPVFRGYAMKYRPSVFARARAATIAAGTIDPVDGSVVGGTAGCRVELQRLYGASQWRTVSPGRLRDSLRFTVSAQPPAGRWHYRVLSPGWCVPNQVIASSAPFVITAA